MFLVNNLAAASGPSANEPVKIWEDLGIRITVVNRDVINA